LVTSSDTTSSIVPASSPRPHSQAMVRACKRAHGVAVGRAARIRTFWRAQRARGVAGWPAITDTRFSPSRGWRDRHRS
jgi:hypothetical protein